jgi:hypothetical protein
VADRDGDAQDLNESEIEHLRTEQKRGFIYVSQTTFLT